MVTKDPHNMDENEQEIIDSTIDTETTDNNEIEETLIETDDELETLRKENETLKAQKEHWRKKASEPKENKETKVEPPKSSSKQKDLSQDDVIAVIRHNVPDEDIELVRKFANLEGKSVKEVLNDDFLKAQLAEKAQMRRTAEATNTGASRRVSSSRSAETSLKNAQTRGEIPESHDDIVAMIRKNKGIE